jgi:hypothetical protein
MARQLRSSAKRSYRRRIAHSKCRKLTRAKCSKTRGCKMAKGKKRTFCRKSRNTRRHRMSLRKR